MSADSEHAFHQKHLAQLLNKKVIGLCVDNQSFDDQAVYGLRFSGGLIAWIQCDPEGNGPGFLSIEKEGK
jgi:hypothetical protein